MDLQKRTKMEQRLLEDCIRLKEYKKAYDYLLSKQWDNFSEEQQKQIKEKLNQIFNKNKDEIMEN